MRRIGIAVAALLATAALAGPVTAAPTSGDFVSGSGYRLLDGERRVQFRIDARESGAGATGTYSYRHLIGDVSFTGKVTCLVVSGNRATVGAVVTKVSGADANISVGDVFTVVFADNGDPYRGQAGPDLVSFTDVYLADDPAYPGCFDPWSNETWLTVQGNVNVKDG